MFEKFDKQIDELLSKMTLREKIGQLNQRMKPRNDVEAEYYKELIRKGEIGSIILVGSATSGDGTHESRIELYNELQKVAVEESPNHIPLIYGLDVIHGHHTVYPNPLASAAAFNDELVERCYRNIAKEATSEGIHWTFSPMLDMSRDPRWGRIVEGPGEDPYVGARFAAATVKGFQGSDLAAQDSLVACAKHYLGYGASEGGRDYHRTEISDYSLYNYYIPAFRAAVDAGVATVMSSFNDINGQPVTSSYHYLTEILRKQLGFEGYVVSDWAAVEQLQFQGVAKNRVESAKMSIEAGLDMDMCDLCYIEHLEKLVQEGKVSEETIDTAVRRVLRVKYASGLFEHPYCENKSVDRTEHLKDARILAGESMVLLKNDGVLPLKKDNKIALLGPFVNERRALLGAWTLDFILKETSTFLEAMQQKIDDKQILRSWDDTGLTDNSIHASLHADVVVLALGESQRMTGESHSVSDISLANEQIELIRRVRTLGKKVVGVFFCGRPIAMDGVAEYLDAIVYAWQSGTETANAVCDILFGDVNPSGKTTVSFPRRTGHIPMYYNVTPSGRSVNAYYGDKGILSYEDSAADPYYPFGYGLSYTTYQYGNIQVQKEILTMENIKSGEEFAFTITVSNVGDMDGKETVQLYIRDKQASVMRPIRELKKYQKVFLPKGATEHLSFTLGYKDLGFYTPDGTYVVESGEFDVFIGENCYAQEKVSITLVEG